jgi:hypothetical protein
MLLRRRKGAMQKPSIMNGTRKLRRVILRHARVNTGTRNMVMFSITFTPVAWMLDPDHRETILGVTYEFRQTGARKTVWYTPNKRRAKRALVVTDLQVS